MRFVYALSLRWRCPKQANTMCCCEHALECAASNRVGRSRTVDCFALLAMTDSGILEMFRLRLNMTRFHVSLRASGASAAINNAW